MQLLKTWPGDILDMAYDPSSDAVWVPVVTQTGDGQSLTEWRDGTQVGSWPLPSFPFPGINLRIKVDVGGAVWISTADTMMRFDPASDELASYAFSGDVIGGLPAATQDVIGGGSAITGFALDGTDALVARNNVPYLTRLGPALTQTATIPLPAGYAGATDLAVTADHNIYLDLWESMGGVAILSPAGAALSFEPGNGERLAVIDGQVLQSGVGGPPTWVTLGKGPATAAAIPPDRMIVVGDPRGGLTVAVPTGVERVVDSTVVDRVSIPLTTVSTHAGGALGGVPLFQPTAIVTDSSGMTWLAAGTELFAVTL
ncbi:MAG TPA: hypothetical protein VEI48_04705 [Candidatus Sulfotelmatobacter sp.]|nr:hypothetical protein [Candidatus Sulfotelmatobacter sp.]